MRCMSALGRGAEAVGVYRRLKQTLSVVLGMKPSAATEHLLHLLRSESSDRT